VPFASRCLKALDDTSVEENKTIPTDSRVDAFLPRGPSDVIQRLPVCVVLHAFRLYARQEAVLARCKCRVCTRCATLNVVVGVIEGHQVFQRSQGGILELSEVCLDVVVEIDLYDGVLGLVGIAATRAPVPGTL
jgi:hypothetical protein